MCAFSMERSNKKINRHKRKKKHVVTQKRPHGKESIEVWITQKIGKERGKLCQKNEEISGRKAHTNTWKLN